MGRAVADGAPSAIITTFLRVEHAVAKGTESYGRLILHIDTENGDAVDNRSRYSCDKKADAGSEEEEDANPKHI